MVTIPYPATAGGTLDFTASCARSPQVGPLMNSPTSMPGKLLLWGPGEAWEPTLLCSRPHYRIVHPVI